MPKRTDRNQCEIVMALRAMGASVTPTHTIGHGFPDLAIGFHGVTLLAEVKNGKAGLTPDEQAWHAAWRGQVCILRTVDDVARLIDAMSPIIALAGGGEHGARL